MKVALVKNLIAAAFGILISTIGKDFMTSIDRFTYGINELSEGIGFIPVVVGLFAISEMLTQSTMLDQVFKRVALKAVKLPSLKDYKLIWKTILRSSGYRIIYWCTSSRRRNSCFFNWIFRS